MICLDDFSDGNLGMDVPGVGVYLRHAEPHRVLRAVVDTGQADLAVVIRMDRAAILDFNAVPGADLGAEAAAVASFRRMELDLLPAQLRVFPNKGEIVLINRQVLRFGFLQILPPV